MLQIKIKVEEVYKRVTMTLSFNVMTWVLNAADMEEHFNQRESQEQHELEEERGTNEIKADCMPLRRDREVGGFSGTVAGKDFDHYI